MLRVGEIDRRTIAKTNELPKLSLQQAADRTWQPQAAVWEAIKKSCAGGTASITIRGYAGSASSAAVSSGRVSVQISRDPVGAPIFYRDVPLMPSETEKGVIKPLSPRAVPLIAWRLRNVGEARSTSSDGRGTPLRQLPFIFGGWEKHGDGYRRAAE